jgi:hypothetical protein
MSSRYRWHHYLKQCHFVQVDFIGGVLIKLIDSEWAQNMSWTVVASKFVPVEWTYLCFSNFVTKCCIYVLLSLSDFLNLWQALYTCFIFVKLSWFLPFKFIKICLGCTKLLAGSTIFILFFSINLPRKKVILWLWTPIRMANYIYFLIKINMQPKLTSIFPWARVFKFWFRLPLTWFLLTTPFTTQQ